MSEFINRNDSGVAIRWKLLTGASALVLTAYISSSGAAHASDAKNSEVWLEFGGQFERLQDTQQVFAPRFTESLVADGMLTADRGQEALLYTNGFEGAIRFRPEDSDWQFSAAIRYGKSNGSEASHEQTDAPPSGKIIIRAPSFHIYNTKYETASSLKFGDTTVRKTERHLILDFQAGHDVGIGLFGGKAVAAFGVRYAQFTDKSQVQITANSGPKWVGDYQSTFRGITGSFLIPTESWDLYHANALISHSFRGVGPSLAFNTSVPFAGNLQNGQLGFDLGVNGALLFGRQSTRAHHETLDQRPYIPINGNFRPLVTVCHHTYDPDRSRSVTVPDVGGFAAISFQYAEAKISLGYRADFFFGAMDGGIDARKTENRGFYGPYASISIGLGD